MEVREILTKEEMLKNYKLLLEVYPSLTQEQYSEELDLMLPHNYGQVGVFDNDTCIGLTGYWIGNKLWSGKYLELDNVVVSGKHRSKGVGELLFDYMNEKAIQEDCNILALDSYTSNFKAHKFFYNQGYGPTGFHFLKKLKKDCLR